MNHDHKPEEREPNKAEIKKENQDFPNIPPATEKIEDEKNTKEVIEKTSEENETGKTDNEEGNNKEN